MPDAALRPAKLTLCEGRLWPACGGLLSRECPPSRVILHGAQLNCRFQCLNPLSSTNTRQQPSKAGPFPQTARCTCSQLEAVTKPVCVTKLASARKLKLCGVPRSDCHTEAKNNTETQPPDCHTKAKNNHKKRPAPTEPAFSFTRPSRHQHQAAL